MNQIEHLTSLLTPIVEAEGALIEEIKITPAGKRRVVTVLVDRSDRNLSLDEVTGLSKAISESLDQSSVLGEVAFTLEVSSPGVDRPLTKLRHWNKNIGRLVTITSSDGHQSKGRITGCESQPIVDGEIVEMENVKRAVIEIEFNRKES
ncbi:MAG: ribosome maturation factor RimP [Actinobacteria bacterium]|jgi:ribosome maturation factor RimP|nr:ribosome maturation factor RimP [Actinomycetota bacterium]